MFVHAQDRATDIVDQCSSLLIRRNTVARMISGTSILFANKDVRAVLRRIKRAALEVESLAMQCEYVARRKEEKPGRHRHRCSHQRPVWSGKSPSVSIKQMLEVCRCGATRDRDTKGRWA